MATLSRGQLSKKVHFSTMNLLVVSAFGHPPCRSKGRRWRISSQRLRTEREMPRVNQNRLRSQCGENSFLLTKLNLKLLRSWHSDHRIFISFWVCGSLGQSLVWFNPVSSHSVQRQNPRSEKESTKKRAQLVAKLEDCVGPSPQGNFLIGFQPPKIQPRRGTGFNC